jgi:hypothetical protein
MNLSRFKALVLSCVATVAFIGCGGGDDATTTTAPIVATGTFVDAPVQGLKYVTATQNGYTDSNGTYKFVVGEQVEFFLGTLSLGKVTASTLVTPYTMAGDTNISTPSDKAKNIAMLLQNFDANRSDSAVLDVSKLKDRNFSDVNLSVASSAMETKITALLGTLNTAGLIDSTTHTLINAATASAAMKTYVTDYNLQLGYGLSNGVNYVGNLSMTAAEVAAAMYLQSTLSMEYIKPGNVIGTVFSNYYVSFFDPAGSITDFSYNRNASSGGTTDAWNLTKETFTAADLSNFPKPTVVNDTTYREKYPDGPNDECTILSSKKVNAVLGVSVDAIEVREFCRCGTDNTYGNGEGWKSAHYNSTYSSIEEFLTQLKGGIGGRDLKLTADNKIQIVSTGEVIQDSNWKLENGILKLKYWDEVWFKLGTDGIIVENWIGDEKFLYIGVTKDQAKLISAKMGLPAW